MIKIRYLINPACNYCRFWLLGGHLRLDCPPVCRFPSGNSRRSRTVCNCCAARGGSPTVREGMDLRPLSRSGYRHAPPTPHIKVKTDLSELAIATNVPSPNSFICMGVWREGCGERVIAWDDEAICSIAGRRRSDTSDGENTHSHFEQSEGRRM